jgi:hypothetical protein
VTLETLRAIQVSYSVDLGFDENLGEAQGGKRALRTLCALESAKNGRKQAVGRVHRAHRVHSQGLVRRKNAMDFDVGELLENLFGGMVPINTTTPSAAMPEAVDIVVDPLAATRFADWVRRPDCHGRMGWELPGLPESDRWWTRCNFDDLPEVPKGFSIGELSKPAPRIAPRCVGTGSVDMLAFGGNHGAYLRCEYG